MVERRRAGWWVGLLFCPRMPLPRPPHTTLCLYSSWFPRSCPSLVVPLTAPLAEAGAARTRLPPAQPRY